jgi:hypothetical protein
MTGPTVVANAERLTKAQLHAKVMRGWARGIDRHGKGTFADRIECSIQALDKQLAGSLPTLETIDRAMDAEPSVLDDYFEAKGKRLVDKEAVCDADDCGLLIARVLVMLNEAEHPNGPGGRAIVPQEYLAGEKLMRDLHAASARWIQRCTEIRQPLSAVA